MSMDQFDERLIAIEEWRTKQLSAQLLAMEAWKVKQQKLLRRVFRWLGVGLLCFMLAVGVGFWMLGNLAESNRKNIEHGMAVDQLLAKEQYAADVIRWDACNDRNDLLKQQLRQDEEQLSRLIEAHIQDDSTNAAKVWKSYLKKGQATKLDLPKCGPKPNPPPTLP